MCVCVCVYVGDAGGGAALAGGRGWSAGEPGQHGTHPAGTTGEGALHITDGGTQCQGKNYRTHLSVILIKLMNLYTSNYTY